VKRSSLIA